MREAQKMMNDPAFQAQMKKMTENPAFQAHMKAQQDMLKDPEKVKELEEKMAARLKEGEELLTQAKEAEKRIKGKEGDKKGEEDDKDKKDDKEDDEKKPAAATKTEEEDDMPDIPNLNLN
jgi:predicted phage gp36 major capsid-like protein